MFSSAVLGKKLGFHTSSAFTRVLVLKASDTCDAISDRRPGTTLPKPSVRASGLLMTVSIASCRRRVSSGTFTMNETNYGVIIREGEFTEQEALGVTEYLNAKAGIES